MKGIPIVLLALFVLLLSFNLNEVEAKVAAGPSPKCEDGSFAIACEFLLVLKCGFCGL
jgi:hypothetical protein